MSDYRRRDSRDVRRESGHSKRSSGRGYRDADTFDTPDKVMPETLDYEGRGGHSNSRENGQRSSGRGHSKSRSRSRGRSNRQYRSRSRSPKDDHLALDRSERGYRDREEDYRRSRDRRRSLSRSTSPRHHRRRYSVSRSPSVERGRNRRSRNEIDDREQPNQAPIKKASSSRAYSNDNLSGKHSDLQDCTSENGNNIEELDEEAKMRLLMGIDGFDSTKGKKVPGTDISNAKINKKRQYRQYMNRSKGFNRALSPG
ncbi:hypothetical protein BATDEDRAFT_86923 [Batrachochytrium dendrobatidis JAM81]|uniref:U4/U6.U5 small nuclear ribonucleoprotein 27kDa protein domain-containing protein n=2 Tax=Batrachochytrium dendrobatidis TaxID=109871 RepID=F4NXL9_BATDJ|nr:uncharacterized protein BATDEDRAFT_86923 [Batrachochytrium dendrobatidis JAM81]EGF82167.1 hypothetical protein BATDEDRAFT_86923 [Batrachochytrium dendrobatidis JAM81]OAJ40494.1 hypothetical protein BDEG_24220 [Batrachochytrium dendrobatidis JEL423]|eukprot:XP_006677658.1 hypothetical protein BATDEDRAFT_86923 [Batrachochytrium dendrobatidis JAM81]